MTNREIRLLAVACTFIGIVVGFLLAPMKAGVFFGNNNNNTSDNDKYNPDL